MITTGNNLDPFTDTGAGAAGRSADRISPAGRSGPGQVWLASPPTVAASAIAGELVSFAELQARHA